MRNAVALLTLIIVLPTQPIAQDGSTQDRNSKDTLYLSCKIHPDPAVHEFIESRRQKGPIVTSPDGRYRAYVEVEAINDSSESYSCTNTSQLYFSDSDANDFKIIKQLDPVSGWKGNGMRVVEWSPDSRYLLLAMNQWVYYSEGFTPYPVIFDTELRQFYVANLYEIIQPPPECNWCAWEEEDPFQAKTVGFDTPPLVLVNISYSCNLSDEEDCSNTERLWRLDLVNKTGQTVKTPE